MTRRPDTAPEVGPDAISDLVSGGALRLLAALTVAASLGACVSFPPAPEPLQAPRLIETAGAEPPVAEPTAAEPPVVDSVVIESIDGARLAAQVWRAEQPAAVLVALHGMNDYGNAFALPAAWWAREARITTYAYDQRGFGRSPGRGRWPGAETLKADLRAVIAAARAAHPGLPVFVAGHSMGGAVVLAAMADAPLDVDGVVLAAPGVWGGRQMPLFYRFSLNIAAGLAPGKTLTGARAGRQSTDNIDVLRAMAADPQMIGETRIDAVLGLVRLMADAWRASEEVGGAIMFLAGEKDEIIPPRAMAATAARLCGDVEQKTYKDGWHLLFRDLQGPMVWRDVAAWTAARGDADGDRVPAAGPARTLCR